MSASKRKMKKVKAWAVVERYGGGLLYTDQEACIYCDFTTALKNKGSHIIQPVYITATCEAWKKGELWQS